VDALEALRDATGDAWLDHVRGAAAFLRRRVTGDYRIDEFGFDEDLTSNVLMPLLRPLHSHYWRVLVGDRARARPVAGWWSPTTPGRSRRTR
jgi:hypothetical protein